MVKIIHGAPGEEILTRHKTLKGAVEKVKEYLINECREEIINYDNSILSIKEEISLGGITSELKEMLEHFKDAIEESEDCIAQIEKCKSIAALNGLDSYYESWNVQKLP